MKPDGSQLLDADVDKMNASDGPYNYPDGGTLMSPFHSTEGNKIFKRNDYYYLQHIEFLDQGQGHGTYVMRSRNLYGTKTDGTPGTPGDPGKYEVLKFGDEIPGQGAFVDTPAGRWFWIGQFNRYGSDGRPPNLLPVTWIDDWPVPGVDITNKVGRFAWQLPKHVAGQPVQIPQGGDEFNSATLNPQWQWNYQPRADKWWLTERPGFLRLHAFKPLLPGNFFKAGNTICQRHFRSESRTVTIKLDISGMADGQEAGLANFNGGNNYATIGVAQANAVRQIKYEEDGKIMSGEILPPGTTNLWLRSTAGFDDLNHYALSFDGKSFKPFGGTYKLKCAGYRGDLIGIYTFNNEADAGFVDADFFHYDFKNK
jgi:beta-xylosidase